MSERLTGAPFAMTVEAGCSSGGSAPSMREHSLLTGNSEQAAAPTPYGTQLPSAEPAALAAAKARLLDGESTAAPASSYRPDIDGLRAVAVIAVIIFHLNSRLLPGGFIGVDVFFVISGFVVTGSLLHTPQPSVCEYFAAFYARRLKRLTPALVLFIVVSALLVPLLLGLTSKDSTLGLFYSSAQLSSVGGANILYALQEDTYWDTTSERLAKNPFLHCWRAHAAPSLNQPLAWDRPVVLRILTHPPCAHASDIGP
jgi:hypothetical protein